MTTEFVYHNAAIPRMILRKALGSFVITDTLPHHVKLEI